MHIHRYRVVEVKNDYQLGGFYTQRVKRRCRCSAVKLKINGYL